VGGGGWEFLFGLISASLLVKGVCERRGPVQIQCAHLLVNRGTAKKENKKQPWKSGVVGTEVTLN